MIIDWSIEGKAVFTMCEYLEDILPEAHADFDGEDVTPAISELFAVNLTHWKLDAATADYFHHVVARFLYVAKKARPDLQVPVAFLCKRVKCPDVGDWKKLGRLMRYVRATIHLPLIVGSNGSGNLIWSIDASFAVHTDMKSHSRYCLSLRIGFPVLGSFTQKINTRSTTKSELVAADDAIGYVEWTSLYSKDQVKEYPTEHPLKKLGTKNIMLQNNTSTIKLVKGGRRVC